MRAFLHINTSFSYDGELSLEEVVEGARALGAGVIFINDRLRGMTRSAYSELGRRARSLSNENLACLRRGRNYNWDLFGCCGPDLHVKEGG